MHKFQQDKATMLNYGVYRKTNFMCFFILNILMSKHFFCIMFVYKTMATVTSLSEKCLATPDCFTFLGKC